MAREKIWIKFQLNPIWLTNRVKIAWLHSTLKPVAKSFHLIYISLVGDSSITQVSSSQSIHCTVRCHISSPESRCTLMFKCHNSHNSAQNYQNCGLWTFSDDWNWDFWMNKKQKWVENQSLRSLVLAITGVILLPS